MSCLRSEELAAIPEATRLLELGCGQKKLWRNSVALDLNPLSKADVVHDLNIFPYPFPDDSFDIVIAEHVIEHLDNVVRVVEELHRIVRHGGVIHIEVPHFSSRDFFTDPTHKHAFSITSFDYFVPAPSGLFAFNYSTTARFNKRFAALSGNTSTLFQRFIDRLAKRNGERFERQFAFWFPREHINFQLEVIKN